MMTDIKRTSSGGITFPLRDYSRLSLVYHSRVPGSDHEVFSVDDIVTTTTHALNDVQQLADASDWGGHFNPLSPGPKGGKFEYPDSPVSVVFLQDQGGGKGPSYQTAQRALAGISQTAQQLGWTEEAVITIQRRREGLELQQGKIDFSRKATNKETVAVY